LTRFRVAAPDQGHFRVRKRLAFQKQLNADLLVRRHGGWVEFGHQFRAIGGHRFGKAPQIFDPVQYRNIAHGDERFGASQRPAGHPAVFEDAVAFHRDDVSAGRRSREGSHKPVVDGGFGLRGRFAGVESRAGDVRFEFI